jgi:hypothetical protein
MKGLYELALKTIHREFYSVLGGTHNDTWEVGGQDYYQVKRLISLSSSVKNYLPYFL